jgi:hypothetical protein
MLARVVILHQLKEQSFANTLPLSTSQEQGRTLEQERERNGDWIEEGEKEEEKYQHLPMDSNNIFNIIMVSSR